MNDSLTSAPRVPIGDLSGVLSAPYAGEGELIHCFGLVERWQYWYDIPVPVTTGKLWPGSVWLGQPSPNYRAPAFQFVEINPRVTLPWINPDGSVLLPMTDEEFQPSGDDMANLAPMSDGFIAKFHARDQLIGPVVMRAPYGYGVVCSRCRTRRDLTGEVLPITGFRCQGCAGWVDCTKPPVDPPAGAETPVEST